MKNSLDATFISTYKPLLEKFMCDINDVNTESLPAPFIPYYGTKYEDSAYKIAFVGWETRNNNKLSEFKNAYNNKSNEVYYWFKEDMVEPFVFLDKEYKFMNNTGKDFWGFAFQFLSKFYGIDEWKDLKNKLHPKILKSFIWANDCSIERYQVADRKDSKIEDYKKVKIASKIFDQLNILLNIFKPNVVILLHWPAPETYITKGIVNYSGPKKIDENFLWYYYIQDTNTHIYWTRHPGSLAREKINFNNFILKILKDIKDTNVFKSFPGEKLLFQVNYLEEVLVKLKASIKLIAMKLQLEYTIDIDFFRLVDSGFYFKKQKWRNFEIGFQFEKDGFQDFFYGICTKDIKKEIPALEITKELLKTALGNSNGVATQQWAWWKWHGNRNWDTQTFTEIETGKFSKKIMKQVEEIIKNLADVEM